MSNIVDMIVEEMFSNQIFADEFPVHMIENYCSSRPDEIPSLDEFKRYFSRWESDKIDDMVLDALSKYKEEILDAVAEYIYDPVIFEDVNEFWHDRM